MTGSEVIDIVKRLKKGRDPSVASFGFAQGINPLVEALRHKVDIQSVIVAKGEKEDIVGDLLSENGVSHLLVAVRESIFASLSSTKTPYSVLFLFKRPETGNLGATGALNKIRHNKLVFAFDSVQDPGNIGTIIRTAYAFFQRNLIFAGTTPDPFSPKVVRSSAGLVFGMEGLHVLTAEELIALARTCVDEGIPVVGTASSPWNGKVKGFIPGESPGGALIIFGNEGNGLSEGLQKICTNFFSIKIDPSAESLNVAVAFGIVAHEMAKYSPGWDR